MSRSLEIIFVRIVLKNFKPYVLPLVLFSFSSLLVVAGGKFGSTFFQKGTCTGHYFGYRSWFSNWDGQWYQYIFEHGYHYTGDRGGYGPQVFFPLYPLFGFIVKTMSGLHGEYLPVTVSWLALAVFSCVWMHYAKEKLHKPIDAPVVLFSLALILFSPNSYFMRVAYTEALYITILAFFFLGLVRRWPIYTLIFICGLLTAARPTGIIACITLALHVWLCLRDKPFFMRTVLAGFVGLVSAWGLYSYMFYLHIVFGDSLLFMNKQLAWNYGMPLNVFWLKWQKMLSLRPIWGFLVDGSLRNISTYPWNLQNRFTVLLVIATIILGIQKKWLSLEEIVFCILSLLLFYVPNAPKGMESVGRYNLTLIPLVLVMARLLFKLPLVIRGGILFLLGFLLFLQTGLFSLWYCVY